MVLKDFTLDFNNTELASVDTVLKWCKFPNLFTTDSTRRNS